MVITCPILLLIFVEKENMRSFYRNKHIIYVIPLFFIFLFACYNKSTKSISVSLIDQRKDKIDRKLAELKTFGLIDENVESAMSGRLIADCDAFIQNKKMTSEDVSDLVDQFLADMDTVKMKESVLAITLTTYREMATANQISGVKNVFTNIGDVSDAEDKIKKWYETRLTEEDRYDMLIDKLTLIIGLNDKVGNISLEQMAAIRVSVLSDIQKMRADKDRSSAGFKKNVDKALSGYAQITTDPYIIWSIVDIYKTLADIKKIDISNNVSEFYKNSNVPPPLYTSFRHLEEEINDYIDMLGSLEGDTHRYIVVKIHLLKDAKVFLDEAEPYDYLLRHLELSFEKYVPAVRDIDTIEFISGIYRYLGWKRNVDVQPYIDELSN